MAILYILYVFLAIIIIAIILVVSFIAPVLQAAPFIATNKKKIKTILDIARPQAGQRVVDLGSGDGRLVIAMARRGLQADGFEINDFLVLWSKFFIKKSGLQNARVSKKNFWGQNLSVYDIVIVFGISTMMDRLSKKLQTELKTGAKVISNGFDLPGWTAIRKDGQVILYEKQ